LFLSCIMAFSACNRPVETQNFASLPHTNSALQAVDSLMWTRPDSALARIMPWLDTCLRDVACNVSKNNGDSGADVARYVSTTFNRHYAQLLLAELLYKNDYPQTNREELLKAVDYFDSLVRVSFPDLGWRLGTMVVRSEAVAERHLSELSNKGLWLGTWRYSGA